MGKLQSLGADTICSIVAFSLGADIVALLTTNRHVRAALSGPVARKHFEAMSFALWGEGCRCRYTLAKATRTSQEDGNVIGNGSGHENPATKDPDWLAFYLRRVGHRAVRPSPLNLLQEHYTEDAYRLLSCCILCSRTSGGDTVKGAVASFFEACPTPTSVLLADQEELRKTLLPLGLNREVILKRFAEGFLTSPWYDPSELHGCGRFASDSWQIFCLGSYRPGDQIIAAAGAAGGGGDESAKKKKKGNGSRRGSLDRNLAAYCRFAQRPAANGEGQGTAVAAGGRVDESRSGARTAATTMARGDNMKRKRSCRKAHEQAARSPRGKGRGRGTLYVAAGASYEARSSKVGVGVATGVVGGISSTREERAFRRGRMTQ
eukprot:g18446.t1